MPPTTTTRGSGLSRSEAAILAWKKRPRAKPKPGALDPKIAARVKEILAEKAKKKGPKAKGKAKGKPKGRAAKPKSDGRTPQEKANQNRAAVAKQGGMDKLEGTIVRLNAGMNSDLEKDAHEELIKKGLAERGADGKPKLTAAGKKWKAAADKGDVSGAQGALAAGTEGAAKKEATEKAKAEKGAAREKAKGERAAASEAKRQERVKKVAERQQQAQRQRKKQKKAREKVKREPSAKEIVQDAIASMRKPPKKAIDMSDLLEIKAGARHSRTDMEHLQGIHDSSVACGASCATESDDVGDVDTETAEKSIKGIMDNPAWYAQHECGDVMQAASALQTLCMLIQSELAEEDADTADVSQLVDAARTIVAFIEGELDELELAARDVARETIGGVPMAKGLDSDLIHLDGGAIKAIGDNNEIGGYAVLFGNADTHDIERDYYTKSTDFWLDHFGWPRPITYHHGMDQATRNDPVIGHWTKAAVDDTGVWLSGQLDRAHAYCKAIKELAARGYLKLSSDSASQWVQREKQPNGANFVKRWPLVTASPTVTPMEPRMLPVEVKAFLADIGYEAIDDNQEAGDPELARSDETKASDDERTRVLLLDVDLMELEETAP